MGPAHGPARPKRSHTLRCVILQAKMPQRYERVDGPGVGRVSGGEKIEGRGGGGKGGLSTIVKGGRGQMLTGQKLTGQMLTRTNAHR